MESGKPSQPAKSILKSYYVTDRNRLRSGDLISAIGQAIVAGVDMIQIREKDLPCRVLEELAVRAVELARQSGRTEILVNDRLDVALATGAAGVHLPATGLPVEAVKRVVYNLGARLLIGVSTHTLEEAQLAAGAGADYLIFGPVFETASKPGQPATGLDTLARVTRSVHVPVFAIGGISPERVDRLAGTGVAGIAGISVFLQEESTRALLTRLQRLDKM